MKHPLTIPTLILTAAICIASPLIAADSPGAATPAFKVEVSGTGRPVILLPGLTCSGDVWEDAVRRHTDTWESHVVTLGGFAGEPRFEGPFLATARDALLAYIEREKLDRPVLIGHSLGGVLAMQMAIAAPDRVGPLVVMDALPFLGGAADPGATVESARAAMAPFRDMMRQQTQAQYEAFQKHSPYIRGMATGEADIARITAWGVASDHIAVADAMYDVSVTDLRGSLPSITAPALVLGTWYGMKDFTTRARVDSLFRAQYAGLQDLRFALADSARHFVMLDAPGWTWNQVDTFLGAMDAATSDERSEP